MRRFAFLRLENMQLPEVHREPMSPTRAMILVDMLMSVVERYSRYTPSLTVPLAKPWQQKLWLISFAGGGARLPISGTYTLTVQRITGGPETAVTATGDGATTLIFDVPALTEPGWYKAVVTQAGAQSVTHFFHVGTENVDTHLPYWEDTFHTTHLYGYEHRWCLIPVEWQQRKPRALKRHPVTFFSHVPDLSELWCEDLVPDIGERGVRRKSHGSLTTAHNMSYPFGSMAGKYPVGTQIDGPRGVGNIDFVSGVLIGRATKFADPASGSAGINYVWSPHRLCRMGPDGKLTTLFGWRTPNGDLPGFGRDPNALEFVGDRSAIPADQNHFARFWGAAWDTRVKMVNPGGEQTEGDGRESHDNPILYVSNGWTCDLKPGIPDNTKTAVWALEFDGRSHATPAKARLVIGGLHDVFGLDFDRVSGNLIIAERAEHRIIEVNPDTGEIVRVVVQGQALAGISAQDHTNTPIGMVEQRRAADCVAPEGIKVKGDYVYFCSKAMECIKRKNLRDPNAPVEHLYNTPFQTQHFMLLDVSDGTFMPEGTLFWGGFEARMHGYLKIAVPKDGGYEDYGGLSQHGHVNVSTGRGPFFVDRDYVGGFAVGLGKLVCGHSVNGVQVFTLAQPDDPYPPTDLEKWKQGEQDLLATMVFNEAGVAWFGHDSPRGLISEAADYVLDYYAQFDVAPPVEEPPVEDPPPVEEPTEEPPVEAVTVVVPEGVTLTPGTYTLVRQ